MVNFRFARAAGPASEADRSSSSAIGLGVGVGIAPPPLPSPASGETLATAPSTDTSAGGSVGSVPARNSANGTTPTTTTTTATFASTSFAAGSLHATAGPTSSALTASGPDIQNSRQRRLGPGSGASSSSSSSGRKASAKRKVLKLLDSPRRVIMNGGRSRQQQQQQQQQGGGGAAAGIVPGGGGLHRAGDSNRNDGRDAARTVPTVGGSGGGGGGNNRQVSPHYSHFRLDGVTTRAMLKAAQGKINGSGVGVGVDLPAAGSTSFSTATTQHTAASPSGPFPTQETTLTCTTNDLKSCGGGERVAITTTTTPPRPTDVLSWLHDTAPHDVLPRILSFAGSRKIDLLSRTCRSWRALALSDQVWQAACEDTGKFRPGVDEPVEPGSWLQHYVDNPLVPTDYGTIEAAFRSHDRRRGAAAGLLSSPDGRNNNARPAVPEHRRSIRVLLKPARYVLRDALVVHAVGDARVTIETVDPPVRPTTSFRGGRGSSSSLDDEDGTANKASSSAAAASNSSSNKRKISTALLRDMLTCRSSSAAAATTTTRERGEGDEGNDDEEEDTIMLEDALSSSVPNLPPSDVVTATAFHRPSSGASASGGAAAAGRSARQQRQRRQPPPPPRRAVLVLKSRKPNEPIVRVRQGTVCLSKLDLVHNASGTDIWNGNAAVQVQPPFDENDNPLAAVPPSVPPTAVLDSVDITSVSGRGVVNIDGGFATIRDCHIHDCAATGLYIGGPGSVANVERTDVLQNGNGNERSRRGIARGHSGVYLEQGVATLRDCNISNNSLTGISAISTENATLDIQGTDLVSNGSIQLEMPPSGSASRRRSVARNNRVAAMGLGRARSGLVAPPPEPGRDDDTPESPSQNGDASRRDRPQSPVADASPVPMHGLPGAANFF